MARFKFEKTLVAPSSAFLFNQLTAYFSLLLLCTQCLADVKAPACSSNIYCTGPLLHTVQMSGVHTDSKTFVDMKMKYSQNETVENFNLLMNKTNRQPSKYEIQEFLNENFEREGSEFEAWEPKDWVLNPGFVNRIKDHHLKDWASQLNLLWKFLGRKMKSDVKENESQYSIIYVPNPVIVPGGRFREFYYWDSYWILRGLLLSEMYDTVKGMLENFLYIVSVYGYIPNGGRKYYAMRSQPPLLIPMVKSYVDATKDIEFLRKNIVLMEKEFQFWMRNRTVKVEKDGKHYTLARYKDESSGPRPESYREDYDTAQIFSDEEDRQNFYSELKSAAESGWDFSTRWFILNATNKGNLTDIRATNIIPVDLNSIIYWNARILSDFYKQLEDAERAIKYEKIARDWLEAVDELLWHEEVGVWLDYDILNDIKRDYFYPTNISPLWTGCYYAEKVEYYVSRVLKYLEKTQIMNNNMGGIPTTLEHSGEQWDYPNAWAPLQYIMIVGLDNTGDSWAQDLAFDIAERWTRSNFAAYNDTNTMFEKYDASVPGGRGSGGEYEIQMGFGWSNGIIMELLSKYGDRLTHDDSFQLENEVISSGSKNSITREKYYLLASIYTAAIPLILKHIFF